MAKALCMKYERSQSQPEPTVPSHLKPDVSPLLTEHSNGDSTDSCAGGRCQSYPNIIGPIVGSLCGILVVALLGVFLVWFYMRRKQQKLKESQTISTERYIEQPPLYTTAMSSANSISPLYGTSPSRNDSIDSHLYEKITYNEPS